MKLSSIYNKIVLISPIIEVTLRKIYWYNVSRLKKFRPKKTIAGSEIKQRTDFSKIIEFLRRSGVGKGSLLIIHSSYDALKSTNLSPEEIIEQLLELIGDTGTLAMPVIRKFKGEPKYKDILSTNLDDLVCTYDVKNSRIVSGLLPYYLMKHKDSVTSRFPLNPMTSVGPLAKKMMENNLEGDFPSPHGPNSSWKFCYDHNAIVIGLGVDLSHYLTITHVAEEAFPNWPISNWYRKRIFQIKDDDFSIKKVVLEREPKWGMLHFAEENYRRDIIKKGLLLNKQFDDIQVGIVNSQELIGFLNNKKSNGYPYYLVK